MVFAVEKRVEFKEETYAERIIEDLYDMLEYDRDEDWPCLSEDQQNEFVVSALEIALQKMKGEME